MCFETTLPALQLFLLPMTNRTLLTTWVLAKNRTLDRGVSRVGLAKATRTGVRRSIWTSVNHLGVLQLGSTQQQYRFSDGEVNMCAVLGLAGACQRAATRQ